MGKYLDIARKLEEQKAESLGRYAENPESATLEPVESGIDFVSLLTDTEREQYFSLMESMQSVDLGMGRETAEREAGAIIARNRHPLQIKQAAQDYRRYGYIKIFSTVLGKAVYFAKDERAAQGVPDPSIPVFLESETEAVKDLAPEVVKLLLEARILFGGPIKKGHD